MGNVYEKYHLYAIKTNRIGMAIILCRPLDSRKYHTKFEDNLLPHSNVLIDGQYSSIVFVFLILEKIESVTGLCEFRTLFIFPINVVARNKGGTPFFFLLTKNGSRVIFGVSGKRCVGHLGRYNFYFR